MEDNISQSEASGLSTNFIRNTIINDLSTGKHKNIVTRFPPEPNGYLHIGHAKAFGIDFGLAAEFGGVCHLRMDDTNPEKEDVEYIEAIMRDIKWFGFDWGDKFFYASDYYDKLYFYAEELIKMGLAYVCDLTPEQTREYRGTLDKPGTDSPWRSRTVEENLDLFRRMKAGEFEEGSRVLRAKIDMNSPNVNMRDPVIYRIKRAHHHRTGDKWCIYPMYDYTHCLSDSMEGITHSLCSLEFEDHRPLYDWFLDVLKVPCHPQQMEFSRFNLDYTVMSKRFLREMVETNRVSGWDDPRMPTLCGLRRRGFPALAIRNLMARLGVTKKDSVTPLSQLEDSVRDVLNETSPRAMAVLKPIKLVVENYDPNVTEEFDVPLHPNKPEMGSKKIIFARELYIEQDDFMENPPKGYFRLVPGGEVRLKYAYIVKCSKVIKDPTTGEITEIHCTYDKNTRGGNAVSGQKVKGTIHWVSAKHARNAQIRIYDRLFKEAEPGKKTGKFVDDLNPNSLQIIENAKIPAFLAEAKIEEVFQFERLGYFCLDTDSTEKKVVINRTVTLRDSWAKA